VRLYDFSAYAERRDAIKRENAAREAVVEVIAHIEAPGAVRDLKQKVDGWFMLHQEVLKKVANLA
jgi:hypothetical protein